MHPFTFKGKFSFFQFGEKIILSRNDQFFIRSQHLVNIPAVGVEFFLESRNVLGLERPRFQKQILLRLREKTPQRDADPQHGVHPDHDFVVCRSNVPASAVNHPQAPRRAGVPRVKGNRLTRASRGTLDTAGNGFAPGTTPQTALRDLDILGNWPSYEACSANQSERIRGCR